MRKFLQKLSFLFCPNSCILCHRLCNNNLNICTICETVLPHIESPTDYMVAFEYAGAIRTMLCNLKYSEQVTYAEILAKLWLHKFPNGKDIDAIVPIPISPYRYRIRGFNQTYELAKVLSSHLHIPVNHSLCKCRNTVSQVGAKRKERISNLRGSFKAVNAPRRVALLDDTITTGATILEAKKTLLDAGAETVEAWAIAMVL